MTSDNDPVDPLAAARKRSAPAQLRRFYELARLVRNESGFSLQLDGKQARTPAGHPLATPHRRLADAVTAEWNAQGEFIEPAKMPATRLVNTALDGVSKRLPEVRAATRAYTDADLLCYRAGEPAELVERQRIAWDPIIAWAEQRFQVRFTLAQGVTYVAQPKRTLTRLADVIDAYDDPFRVAALNLATTLSGSAIIALALPHAALDAKGGWAAAHVDEDWNISQWGEDAEAKARRDRRRADFEAAALALS